MCFTFERLRLARSWIYSYIMHGWKFGEPVERTVLRLRYAEKTGFGGSAECAMIAARSQEGSCSASQPVSPDHCSKSCKGTDRLNQGLHPFHRVEHEIEAVQIPTNSGIIRPQLRFNALSILIHLGTCVGSVEHSTPAGLAIL